MVGKGLTLNSILLALLIKWNLEHLLCKILIVNMCAKEKLLLDVLVSIPII